MVKRLFTIIIIMVLICCKTPVYNNVHNTSVLLLYSDTISKVLIDSIIRHDSLLALYKWERTAYKDYETKRYNTYYVYTKDTVMYRVITYNKDSMIITKRLLR